MTLSRYVGSFSIAGVADFGSYLFYGYRGSWGLFFFSTFVQPTQVWKKIIFKGREGIARQLWRKLLYWVEAIIAKFGEVHEYRRFRRKLDQLRFTLKIQKNSVWIFEMSPVFACSNLRVLRGVTMTAKKYVCWLKTIALWWSWRVQGGP